jgi:hypothetical protein
MHGSTEFPILFVLLLRSGKSLVPLVRFGFQNSDVTDHGLSN